MRLVKCWKNIWAVGLCLLLCTSCLGLWGCSFDKDSKLENETGAARDQDSFYSVVTNNLAVLTSDNNPSDATDWELPLPPEEGITYADDCNFYIMSATISGLKDEQVQAAIQAKIDAALEKISTDVRPPYRGIRASVPNGSQIIWKNVYIAEDANFANILSLHITKNLTYAVPDKNGEVKYQTNYGYRDYENSVSVGQVITLNFDLNTGEEIKLEDVFKDNCDYMTVINDQMKAYLDENEGSSEYDYYGSVESIGPFKGLNEDQKFSISNWGLILFFDEDTPDFDVHKNAMPVTLNYSDLKGSLAIDSRFLHEERESLFTDETVVKSLIQDISMNDVNERTSKDIFVNEGKPNQGNLYISTAYSYDEDMPQNVKDKIIELGQVDEAAIEELKEDLSEKGVPEDGSINSSFYENYVSCSKMGTYISIDSYTYDGLHQMGSQIKLCYDRFSGEEIKLKDLFVEGLTDEQQKQIIENGIKLYFEEDVSYDNSIDSKDQNLIESFYNAINGFGLGTDYLYLSFDLNMVDDENERLSYGINISYKNLGCENLAIFK